MPQHVRPYAIGRSVTISGHNRVVKLFQDGKDSRSSIDTEGKAASM
jgi:hypothetical protein